MTWGGAGDADRLPFPCEGCGFMLRIRRSDLVADTGRPYLCVGCALGGELGAAIVAADDAERALGRP